jgi:hypothetical protein
MRQGGIRVLRLTVGSERFLIEPVATLGKDLWGRGFEGVPNEKKHKPERRYKPWLLN